MNNIIQQHLINFTTKLIKNVEETISKEWDLTKLVDVVKKMTDELGANIIKDFLEELDKTIKEDEKKEKGMGSRKERQEKDCNNARRNRICKNVLQI